MLAYVDDRMPGYGRVRRGRGFAYLDTAGRVLRDAETLTRIRRLAIPPAYTDIWICPLPHGHLQATGRDARGRKQYRYHADWKSSRDAGKYERLLDFAAALPRIRARVRHDLAASSHAAPPTRELVLATLVRLLDTTFLRIGNEAYARDNHSYGLTTLRCHHVGVRRGGAMHLRFRGKSGVQQEVSLVDPKIARVVRRCQHLPGQELFRYVAEDGSVRSVGSGDVNDYLDEAAGGTERYTAKDFRTWHGSVQALALAAEAGTEIAGDARGTLQRVLSTVASRLGNTVAVCRKAYVHPGVLEFCAADTDARATMLPADARVPQLRGLSADERRLVALLRRLARQQLKACPPAPTRRRA